ncbi:2-phytyl-1,4-beta-naphthoquinone methyltransferase, chloroplastic [Quillaja saponaria]|uniref:2-phytyl-1,4-beta-naphthoquinone methyltransferase, chloroplastic n=1 Tax=Quillaja saponaria TaxID=32244 RepID=A0AAD7L9H0_QUISA|nr:2-phytyl-1,4-beta-naphthoquinone methyltransferase, chloroplastic [Quillaja saponaria]
MASFQLSLPSSSTSQILSSRLRYKVVRCGSERQALFRRIAPVYDNLSDLLSLGAKMGDHVLDLCCGSGDLAFLLSEKVGSSGKHSLAKSCFMNIKWVEGDALDLPFSDGYFDAITMGYGLRNVVNKRRAMKEILRVLKAGSRVSILDFNKSNEPLTALLMEGVFDNFVIPAATGYGLAEKYRYFKSSIREFLTGERLEKLALQIGFSSARHYEIIGGLMGNLVAKKWVEGDALDLPFSDGYFDAITMGYGLRNVVNKRRAMKEILRVLKAGSRVSILDFNKSNEPLTALLMEGVFDNFVIPAAIGYGLAEKYRYFKSSIRDHWLSSINDL